MEHYDRFWEWPFDPQSDHLVAGLGFWISIMGLVLTFVGFGITFAQLKKTRSAADAAKSEAARIEISLARYQITNEAAKASAALDTARNYLRADLWMMAGDSYETVRDSFDALRLEVKTLTDDHKTRIEEATRYIRNFCSRVERDRVNSVMTINSSKTLAVMGEHRLLLAEITRVLEKDVLQ